MEKIPGNSLKMYGRIKSVFSGYPGGDCKFPSLDIWDLGKNVKTLIQTEVG